MIERWKSVEGFEDHYEISTFGNFRSRGRIVAKNKQGERYLPSKIRIPKIWGLYYNIGLNNDGFKKNMLIHRMVAIAFVPNPNNYPCVNHLDGDKLNNHYLNLEWCTHQQNIEHAFRTGLASNDTPYCEERHGLILEIRKLRPLMKRGHSLRISSKLGYPLGCVKEAVQGEVTGKHRLKNIYDAMIYDLNHECATPVIRNNKGQFVK